jgi:hypothetical protein
MAVAANFSRLIAPRIQPGKSPHDATAPIASTAPARQDTLSGQLPEFAGVFRGRELTRKDRRIASCILPLDHLIEGGLVRGRISEFVGSAGSGKTSLAAGFAAAVTRREAAAWIEASDDFDPSSMAAAGIELARLLWVSCRNVTEKYRRRAPINRNEYEGLSAAPSRNPAPGAILKAAEWILALGGFGLIVIDFGHWTRPLSQSTALRLARAAERSGTAVIVLGEARMCGTFAALSLAMRPGAPPLFDGIVIEGRVARNKLGGSGRSASWKAMIDPSFAAGSGARANPEGLANNSDRHQRRTTASS